MKFENKLENKKGITLIALVLTIVVLLILAGVTIATLTGDNGIITRTNQAKEETEKAGAKEKVQMEVAGSFDEYGKFDMDKLKENLKENLGLQESDIKDNGDGSITVTVDGYEVTVDSEGNVTVEGEATPPVNPPETGDVVTTPPTTEVEKDTIFKDPNSNNKEAVIPKGFKVSQEKNEQNINTGLVILDKDGNEYVWIPIINDTNWGVDWTEVKSSEEDTEDYFLSIENALKKYTNAYQDKNYEDSWYGDKESGLYGYYNGDKFIYYTNGNMTENEYAKLYQDMLKSIYKHNGFYIARYEMGIDVVNSSNKANDITRTDIKEYTVSKDTNISTDIKNNAAPSIENLATPISKENAVPYTYITQSQAQMLAESLEYENMKSSLMFGIQWDIVCVFIEKFDNRNIYGSEWLTNNEYSKAWGNYKNSVFNIDKGYYELATEEAIWNEKRNNGKTENEQWYYTTGAVSQNKSLNIYDFAGNVWEYTLEKYNGNAPCVSRGSSGLFNESASTRRNYETYSPGSARVSLWVIE